MEFSLFAALVSGFLATLIMSLFSEVASANGFTTMPTVPFILGTMFTGKREEAVRIGAVLHFAVFGTLVFGTMYATLFSIVELSPLWLGVSLGVGHGAVVGVGFSFVDKIHPRLVEPSDDGPMPVSGILVEQGRVQLVDPGVFGVNWGAFTPPTLVAAHAVYGWVFAAVYMTIS